MDTSRAVLRITAIQEFVQAVNCSNKRVDESNTTTDGGISHPPPRRRAAVTAAVAVKFLLARKFDVPRAVALYELHEEARRDGLYDLDQHSEKLRRELETGKFTILPERDESGAAIALFTANRHYPLSVDHQTTLQGIVFQLDVVIEQIETQKAGLIFIYDMSGSKYSNFDYELSKKILTLLKGGYPARLKKVLIVTAPLWFKAPFKILRLFVREKLRDRVYTVSASQLSLHVPRQSLPRHLGGPRDIDHSTWLGSCYEQQQQSVVQMTNREEGSAGEGETEDTLLVALKNSLDILTNNVPVSTTTEPTVPSTANANVSVVNNGNGGGDHESEVTSTTTTEESVATLVHNNPIISLVTSLGDLKDEEQISNRTNNNNNNTINDSGSAEVVDANALPTTIPVDQIGVEKLNLKNNNNLSSITNNESWTENPPSSASSGFSDDDSLAGSGNGGDYKTIDQIVEMVRERGRTGLMVEYAEIKMRAPEGTFTHARLLPNMSKNRYTDVLCYDHSRVVLSGASSFSSGLDPDCDEEDSKEADGAPAAMHATTDYINANFVDGYKQKNAYISTQGPLPKTSADFWRMVWEQRCLVIVMTTRVNERGRIKCGQYWDTQEGSAIEFGPFRIHTTAVVANEDYTVATLELTDIKTEETRRVSHWQFTSWPDYGVPSTAMAMLTFLQRVRDQQATMVEQLGVQWTGHPRGPPIVVHCSAGIGRTGTFITLDICISRLRDMGTVDIRGTVEKIRSQRAYSIQMPDQYVFCHLALIEYALSQGMISSVDLAGFDNREDESD